jgi:hypothetical protein
MARCEGLTKDGNRCRRGALKGTSECYAHRTSAIAKRGPIPRSLAKMGIYRSQLNQSLLDIAVELEKAGSIEELKKPTLEEELVLSRLQVMELTSGNAPPGMRLKALELVGRIARTAKQLQEIETAKFKEEFLDSLINAVTFAFHRANILDDPADRNKAFIEELAMFFPQVRPLDPQGFEPDPKDIIEGEVVGLST